MPYGAESNVKPLKGQTSLADGALLDQAYQQHRIALVKYLEIRIGSHGDAQDIAQAAFAKLWERRDHLHTDSLASLLFVTARNLANDMLRKQARQRSYVQDELATAQVADTTSSPDRILTAKREIETIRRLLRELPKNCRHAFIRYKFDGFGYDEIAREMSVSESMIRKHVIRAIAHCSRRLADLEEWV